jgi:hypothetical protein
MNEKVNTHIKFSGFVGFDLSKDDCFFAIWTISKGRGNCSIITHHSPRRRIANEVDCSAPSAHGHFHEAFTAEFGTRRHFRPFSPGST